MKMRNNTFKIVMTALMMCLIMVATMFIRIPIPGTQGYVHLGDAMIFLSVLILGWKYGALAAAFGSMLADIIGGFAMWAPWSFAIKGIMALILGLIVMKFAGGGGKQRQEVHGRGNRGHGHRGGLYGGSILCGRRGHVRQLAGSGIGRTMEYRAVRGRNGDIGTHQYSLVQDTCQDIFYLFTKTCHNEIV